MVISSQFATGEHIQIEPEDFQDSVATLNFAHKIGVKVAAPGLGPTNLLEWANAELAEAQNAPTVNGPLAQRKSLTATILAKTAVECLIDWYLNSTYLEFTLRAHANTEEKLDALNAESFLSVGTSLFREVLFQPRNRAIHNYEVVELKSAQHAVELARLFITNAQRVHDPSLSNVYYGSLEFARGKEALRMSGISPKAMKNFKKIFYFGGIGAPGQYGVFLSRSGVPRITILESCGDNTVNMCSVLLNKFKPSMLREIFNKLESGKPQAYEFEPEELRHIIGCFDKGLNGKI